MYSLYDRQNFARKQPFHSSLFHIWVSSPGSLCHAFILPVLPLLICLLLSTLSSSFLLSSLPLPTSHLSVSFSFLLSFQISLSSRLLKNPGYSLLVRIVTIVKSCSAVVWRHSDRKWWTVYKVVFHFMHIFFMTCRATGKLQLLIKIDFIFLIIKFFPHSLHKINRNKNHPSYSINADKSAYT